MGVMSDRKTLELDVCGNPKPIEVLATEVVVGDRIANRNSCGGLERWEVVTHHFGPGGIGTASGGCYSCRASDKVEIHAVRPT